MSSASAGGDPAPASSANPSEQDLQAQMPVTESSDSTQSPSEASPAAENTSGGEETRRKPIRIGTQRYGVKPPQAVPKPVNTAPPVARPVSEEAETSETDSLAGQADSGGETTDSPAAESQSGESKPAESKSSLPPRGPREGKPGKSDKKQASRVPVLPPSPTSRVELPNLRAGLSEELELEYLAALGGQSVDDIITEENKQTTSELEPESRHKGTVIAVHRDNVFVEIGGHHQGVVGLKNFVDPPEIGAVLDLTVSRFNAVEGLYELTLPGGAIDVGDWSDINEGMLVEARVTGHNKGGLECEVNHLRGFIPASQVSMYRVEDLSQFVDEKFTCVVTEANPEKRNLVLSRRGVLEREKAAAKESMMASLQVGNTLEGTVRSLQAFGAFVDMGGVDGLIHISQLSWDRLKHADEVLEIGQKVKVKILKIDPETGKIGLGFRDLSENPWENVARDFPTRSPVKGRVSRVTEFGAFVRLAPGVEGLVHISELSHKRVFRVTDVLTEGQEVEVMVLTVDTEQQRIGLSLKALEARAQPVAKEEPEETEPETPVAPRKPRKVPLKGGTGGPATGEKFGLKW